MVIKLWESFSKRKNSTKQPPQTVGSYTEKNVVLKEPTSIESPTFILTSASLNWNYCFAFGHYYYIDDIVAISNTQFELVCSQDLLATYKSAIQGTTAHVLYHNHTNTEISDPRLSTKTTQLTSSQSANFTSLGLATPTTCTYMITAVGEDKTAVYACDQSAIQGLIGQSWYQAFNNDFDQVTPPEGESTFEVILDTVRYIRELIASAVGSIFNSGKAAEYLRNCYILPVRKSDIVGTADTEIYLGRFATEKYGTLVLNRIVYDSATVTIPWQASDWRRNAPYHEIYLHIPFIGLTTVSPSDVIGETSLQVLASLDVFSGDIIFTVKTATKIVAQYTTNIASSYSIGASNIDTSSAATSLVAGSIVGAVSGGLLPAAAGAVGLGLANVINPQPASIGSNGGGAALGTNANQIICYTVFHDTTVAPGSVSSIIGTPTNATMALSGISGYVQTANASVNIAGLGKDKDEINSLLDGGIYIE